MRALILDTALAIVATSGYSNATVREIADAVGLSANGILRYFGSKDVLFAEVLQRHDAALEEQLASEQFGIAADLGNRIVDSLNKAIREPGFSQLALHLAIEGTEVGHVAHETIRERYSEFRRIVETALTTLKRDDELSSNVDPADMANIIVSAFDGLQLQWLYDNSIDVPAKMTALLRALGVRVTAPVDTRHVVTVGA